MPETEATPTQIIWLATCLETHKLLGTIGHDELCELLELHLGKLKAGRENVWPPDANFGGKPCRFSALRIPVGPATETASAEAEDPIQQAPAPKPTPQG
jgi:hypothetical protein